MPMTTGAHISYIDSDVISNAVSNHLAAKGRPTTCTPEILAEILTRLQTNETLTAICQDDHMPHLATFYRWKDANPALGEAYAAARRHQGTTLADSARDLTDATQNAENLTQIRSAEIRAKMQWEQAKCYDRDQYGQQVKVEQTVTLETMDQRIQRLTGRIINLPAEIGYHVEE